MESKNEKIGQMQGPMLFPVERKHYQQILRMLIRGRFIKMVQHCVPHLFKSNYSIILQLKLWQNKSQERINRNST